ncbi:MAG: hypothetical protein U5O39_07690 [Gammaproteobacteria bacterium]|nr:hypothetical protein [Gammaproteobacteria bacterium]
MQGELASLFEQPGVRDRIEESQIRYLAWIDGDTITIDQGGSFSCTLSSFGGGCFGMTYWEEDASYEASIWDLENLTSAGEISADANGTSYLAGTDPADPDHGATPATPHARHLPRSCGSS